MTRRGKEKVDGRLVPPPAFPDSSMHHREVAGVQTLESMHWTRNRRHELRLNRPTTCTWKLTGQSVSNSGCRLCGFHLATKSLVPENLATGPLCRFAHFLFQKKLAPPRRNLAYRRELKNSEAIFVGVFGTEISQLVYFLSVSRSHMSLDESTA